ncbi:Cu-Zn family superoxide dismutase [Actinopolymorpha pittospori]|uniref:Cu-Zn family superoxide dismutase n=1 Tax=Actinopolymorpha pittospori TaxID=648752 RepID=A0A927N871_9ACTN|nr:Cu-Zn family superoxide dismutase [Actinopolymorpha pittospori]
MMSTALSVMLLATSPFLLSPAVGGQPVGTTSANQAVTSQAAALLSPERPVLRSFGRPIFTSRTFEPADSGATALTYDETLVPVGSRATVAAVSSPHGTATLLVVNGLVPRRHYGAHVHVNRCGEDPADAGPHVQWRRDPVQPSTDPDYANPRNEIWLDFTTGRTGTGIATSLVPWPISERQARSVVIHEHHTSTEPGHAGTAGARLACVDVDFAGGIQMSDGSSR